MPIVEPRSLRPRSPRTRSRDDDTVLVSRTRAGDEQAFAAIFKRHHAPLLSYCRHVLGNRDEGEDALQQAFIKAHQALLGGTEPRELRPWLYAIARNCCLSAIAARRPTAPLEDRIPTLAGLSDEVRRREDLRDLLAAIGHLPEDQRSALLLAELDDLSHEAIAKIVGCPVSKVKALVYQARSTLIADRDARETPCQDIREQLSIARGGELRRGPLRRHLNLCAGCRDFQLAVGAQRQSLAALLPVLPSAGLAATILGHGASHAAVGASIGGAGAGAAPAGGAAGAGIGVPTTGATAAGGSGIAASGTAAASTAVAAGAGAGTGAGGATSVGALVGGGLITKLAVGGTVVALATAGAVAVRPHPARAISTPDTAISARVAAARLASFAARRSEAAGVLGANSGGPYGAPGSGSPVTLAGAGDPASSAGPEPLTGITSGGGARPLLTLIGASPPSPVLNGLLEVPTVKAGPSSGGEGSPATAPKACAEARCATLGPRALRLRRARRAQLRKALRRARRRAQLRKALRKARRRARPRGALRKTPRRRLLPTRPKLPKPPKPTPPLAPAPTPIHRRKARPTAAPLSSPTENPAGSESGTTKGTADPRHRPAAGTSATSTAVKDAVPEEASTTRSGGGKGKADSGARTEKAGSSAEAGGSAAGKAGAGAETSSSGAGGEETGSGTRTGRTNSETGTGSASTSGTSDATESGETASHTGETTAATGADATRHKGATPHPQKQHLVEETQLPNL